jgi:hypothetical protein
MNMDCFLKRYSSVFLSSDGDPTFETFKILIGGTTSTRIAKLLNFAVSQIGHDECYLETGVFTGCTLVSAHWANGRLCYGIDPYNSAMNEVSVAKPDVIRDQARLTINHMAAEARLIEKDFRDVKPEEITKKVAVSFVDARHTEQDVTDNLNWLHPLLADDALLFFDDINYLGVSIAISKWLSAHGDTYDLTAYIKPFFQDEQNSWSVGDRVLNNGVCILRYHKNPAAVGVLNLVSDQMAVLG